MTFNSDRFFAIFHTAALFGCFAVALLLACGGGAAAQDADADAVARTFDAYRLGPGDRLRITVIGHPRDSGIFEVDGLGNMAYPPLGSLKARGNTVAEMQVVLRARLDREFDFDAPVRIDILIFRPFFIYGEVKRAGSYPYATGLTVRRAVSIAGGFTSVARRSEVNLIREGRKGLEKHTGGLERKVLPGDIIEVSRQLD